MTHSAFISYSYDSEAHKDWVKQLATRLRTDEIDVRLDQWDVVPGDLVPQYMEKAITDTDFTLIICTPQYKIKSDDRKGGTGYESNIITAEILAKNNERKFILYYARGIRLNLFLLHFKESAILIFLVVHILNKITENFLIH